MGLRSIRVCRLGLLCALLGAWLTTSTPALAQDADAATDGRAEIAAPAGREVARISRRIPFRDTIDITVEGGLSFSEDPDGILGEPLPGGAVPFNWGENSYDGAFGVRVTVGLRVRGGMRWEVRGSWLGSFDASSVQARRQFGFRGMPGAGLVLSPQASATLANETDIWSGELNWWRTVQCDDCSQLDWGIGGRVIGIDDEATATNWVGLTPDAFLRGEAENRFLGAQLMGSWRRRAGKDLTLAVTGKVLLGWMNREMTESDTSIVTGGPTTNGAREESDFSWGFELEVGALWRVMPRIGISASYTLLYLDEVSRAEGILDLGQAATGSVQVGNSTDSALVHSLFVGVRIDF